MNHIDTIVALATPQGQGGIGIIRISGEMIPKIAHKLLKTLPYPKQATYLPLYDYNHKNILDNIIAIFFPKPNSFTGEDVLEIHGHGGQIILEIIIQNILKISQKHIRLALPGEFSERAFINNKLDLIQAEAISDLINANSHQAAMLAAQTLQGNFSKKIHKIEKKISNLRVYIEANLNFPEEQTQILDYKIINTQIQNIINEITQISDTACNSITINQGIKIVIIGKPNSGKSSLFNILCEKKAAIVTPIPGTTRDTLHEYIQLNGILVHIVDTAGIQLNNNLTKSQNNHQIDKIEKIGIKRAWNEIKKANHILLLTDSSTTTETENHQLQLKINKQLQNNVPITIIKNKADLTKEKINIAHTKEQTTITISAKYNQGINLIKTHLKNHIKTLNNQNGNFMARQRHIEALKLSHQHLSYAKKIINNYHIKNNKQEDIILAEELRYAHTALNTITGKSISKTVLKKIFSTFCIGK